MTEVISDTNGDFQIDGIPEGEYRLQIEVTGVAMDLGSATINIDAEGTPVVLTAMVSADGIVLEEVVTSLDEIFTNSITVYPNPFDHKFSLTLENELMGRIEVRIFTTDGRVLYMDAFNKDNLSFKFRMENIDVPSGLIMLQLIHKDATAIYRLIRK